MGHPVGGFGFAGAEVFDVFHFGFAAAGGEGVEDGLAEEFGVGFGAEVEEEFAGGEGGLEAVGEFGCAVGADEVADADVAAFFGGHEGHLEVGDFDAGHGGAGAVGDGEEEFVAVDVGEGADVDGGVEPAEEGFAFGVGDVVDVGGGFGLEFVAGDAVEPGVDAAVVAGGDAGDAGLGEAGAEGGFEAVEAGVVEEVRFVDDDEFGFLELFGVDVEDFGGEAGAGGEAEDAFGADGIDEDGEGGDAEGVAVDLAEGEGDGGDEVGAGADGFGDEDVGAGGIVEAFGGFDEGIEAAAEAAAGDLFDGEVGGGEEGGIDEADGLVVGDEADAFAGGGEVAGELEDGGGLPAPRKPPIMRYCALLIVPSLRGDWRASCLLWHPEWRRSRGRRRRRVRGGLRPSIASRGRRGRIRGG